MKSARPETASLLMDHGALQGIFQLQFEKSPNMAGVTETKTGKFLAANKAFETIGWSPSEVIGRTGAELNIYANPEDRDIILNNLANGINEFHTQIQIRTRTGALRLVRFYVNRLIFEGRDLLFTHAIDITEETRLRNELKQSENLFRSLFSGTPTGIYFYKLSIDNQLIFQGANPAADQLLGLTHLPLIGKSIEEAFPGLRDTAIPELYKNIARNATPTSSFEIHYQYEALDAWFDVTVFNTGPDSIAVNFTDITTRKTDETRIQALLAEKELLLKETHHRIKNNMSIIKSILSLQAADSTAPEEQRALQVAAARVESMMVLYDKLYTAEHINELDLQHYLPPLVEEILRLFDKTDDIKTSFDIMPIIINTRFISPLGIIINELITNSIKHAFGQTGSGSIRLEANYVDQLLTLTYADSGPGIPEKPGNGLGMLLINSLAKQLGGTVSISNEGGAVFRLQVKLS